MSNHSAPPGDRAAPPAVLRRTAAANGLVILVVDDDAAVRATVLMQLEWLGYTVREADGAQTALQIIDSADRIDLLLTDVVMPGGMNGKDLAIAARHRRPDLPILFTSGFPDAAPHQRITFDERDVLLRKPFHRQDLARAVRDVLAPRR